MADKAQSYWTPGPDCWYLSVEAALKEFGESLGTPADFRKKLTQYCNEHVLSPHGLCHLCARLDILFLLSHFHQPLDHRSYE